MGTWKHILAAIEVYLLSSVCMEYKQSLCCLCELGYLTRHCKDKSIESVLGVDWVVAASLMSLWRLMEGRKVRAP